MNEIGIFSWFGYEQPLPERLALIAEAGFRWTCLWLGQDEPMVAAGRRDDMPAMARDAGLAVDNVHASCQYSNLLWADTGKDRRTVRADYEDTISFCGRHGIPLLVAHIAEGPTPPPQTAEGIQVLRHLTAFAEGNGVILALENTRRPDYLDQVFEHIGSPGLGFCYDSSHDFLQEGTRGALLGRWGVRLVATHFSDNDGEEDDHWLPGDGRIDWTRVKAAFPAQTYAGRIMLEVKTKNPTVEQPRDFVRRAHAVAQRLQKTLA